ncbi:hypothetical protein LGH70_05545 [Hymenobacter sp. BT635]|uniref:Uncharacterized protein n=1 Tax=Hymenobacter nitidus TaxID=2880929 RepID=A0ABS8A9H2_9BACT|nr:hypothetical protein [Hymenobacter nitidus]MCB2377035.1 hypothetical protein [Hymenobacter nitidus]
MKINRQFNTLSLGECLYLLEHHRNYTDFNTLGLFRGIVESTKLSLEEKQRLRDLVVAAFAKPFDFLQLKDPVTYFALSTLGEELTVADQAQAWENIRLSQQRILASKKLRHRSFGTYSKHLCGYDDCHLQGLMIRQGSLLSYGGKIRLCTDKNRWDGIPPKAAKRRQERKTMKRLIATRAEDE